MKIALIGATGRVGSRLATELGSGGHAVTGTALHTPTDIRAGIAILQGTRPIRTRLRRALWVTHFAPGERTSRFRLFDGRFRQQASEGDHHG